MSLLFEISLVKRTEIGTCFHVLAAGGFRIEAFFQGCVEARVAGVFVAEAVSNIGHLNTEGVNVFFEVLSANSSTFEILGQKILR